MEPAIIVIGDGKDASILATMSKSEASESHPPVIAFPKPPYEAFPLSCEPALEIAIEMAGKGPQKRLPGQKDLTTAPKADFRFDRRPCVRAAKYKEMKRGNRRKTMERRKRRGF